MADEYRVVVAVIRRVHKNSIAVEIKTHPDWQWIPRSLIHGGDDRKLDDIIVGSGVVHSFRMMSWKAEAIGLA